MYIAKCLPPNFMDFQALKEQHEKNKEYIREILNTFRQENPQLQDNKIVVLGSAAVVYQDILYVDSVKDVDITILGDYEASGIVPTSRIDVLHLANPRLQLQTDFEERLHLLDEVYFCDISDIMFAMVFSLAKSRFNDIIYMNTLFTIMQETERAVFIDTVRKELSHRIGVCEDERLKRFLNQGKFHFEEFVDQNNDLQLQLRLETFERVYKDVANGKYADSEKG